MTKKEKSGLHGGGLTLGGTSQISRTRLIVTLGGIDLAMVNEMSTCDQDITLSLSESGGASLMIGVTLLFPTTCIVLF